MSPLILRRIERFGRQFHAIPVVTCLRVSNSPDKDLRIFLGDGRKLNGRGFDGSVISVASAEHSRRSEYPIPAPAVYSLVTSGTMKMIQKHTTSSLHLFLNRQELWCTDIGASLEVSRFISSVCTERVGDIPHVLQQRNSRTLRAGCNITAW